MTERKAPPDREQRDLIVNELDVNMLVEAAAGTGKTTSMLGRMAALLRTGKCPDTGTLAAVTFTRKAAAELRARFQVTLEKAMREAEGDGRANLERAISRIDHCYIGTIHSFCARLLRERPVEAGVGLDFEELDEDADMRLRREAWDEYMARLYTDDPGGLLTELRGLGIDPRGLWGDFKRFAEFPDVQEWPVPGQRALPDIEAPLKELDEYIGHMKSLEDRLPADSETCNLMPAYRRLPRQYSHYDDLRDLPQLVELLRRFDRKPGQLQRAWMAEDRFTREECKSEAARWDDFRNMVVVPFFEALREYSYEPVLGVMREAVAVYDMLRAERSQLNFQDLLMKAAGLLKGSPHVRRYFMQRFTHILVDEFQDTDPIQAEVLVLLTADDPEEDDWRRCRPRPGSLFVVGDPKQSIYRFRRADIVTYREMRDTIFGGEETGGAPGGGRAMIVKLSANFRSTEPVVDWVNEVFAPGEGDPPGEGGWQRFPSEYSDESPSYVPLLHGREEGAPGDLDGVHTLCIPDEFTQMDGAIAYESERIALTIKRACEEGTTVPRTWAEVEDGVSSGAAFSDFMVVPFPVKNLSVYARALQCHGIPHRVTGGAALNEVRELRLLHTCLRAVTRPDDAVSLVAALRSELFGLSDAALYSFKKAGGRFSFRSPLPEALSPEVAVPIGEAFSRLCLYAGWLAKLPPVSALERILADTGLVALAGSHEGGDVQAGSLLKAVELLREAQRDMWSMVQLVDYVGALVASDECYDGISARSGDGPSVRVINLHKAKGLEAPVVFLSDPSGGKGGHPVLFHIDRSGERVAGYMSFGIEVGKKRVVVARPRGWDSLVDKEGRFLDAERLRLRYVAGTRAGSALVVTQRRNSADSNMWRHFTPWLEGVPEIEEPGASEPGERPVAEITTGDVAGAKAEIEKALAAVEAPTCGAEGAKKYALSREPAPGAAATGEDTAASRSPAVVNEGEHGVEWGSVIHMLLEVAMKESGADLERLAAGALAEQGLDPRLAEAASGAVRSVTGSKIWERARKSERVFTEVPFQVMAGPDAEVPTVLRGSIDLVFLEGDGWVLVDYKTDAWTGSPEALVRRYASQVRLYASAWEDITKEPVRETALYLLRAGVLVPVPRA